MKRTPRIQVEVIEGRDSLAKANADIERTFKEEISKAQNAAKRALDEQYIHSLNSLVPAGDPADVSNDD